MSNFVIVV
ncbi:BgTH12-00625 [Blumeria graminis f. sp. triticale]|uniref:BgTH12-00625 n=1 Tax=Blumeria graminis f. sp. triticale TaxID=1689686 RepID=A0A9W4GIQ0_BLUGR|nr:BgTH12-00625 [Blumeria graminis f. sp. triticale]